MAFVKVEAGNNLKNLSKKWDKSFLYYINQKKLLKKYTKTYINQYNYKNGYYIYELWK